MHFCRHGGEVPAGGQGLGSRGRDGDRAGLDHADRLVLAAVPVEHPLHADRVAVVALDERRDAFIGIGGAGMSAIALVLHDMGHQVSGSDLKDSPVAERLRSHGIAVAVGHAPGHVAGADAVTFSPAVPPENPELAEARARGIRVAPRSEMLAAICANTGRQVFCSPSTKALASAGDIERE